MSMIKLYNKYNNMTGIYSTIVVDMYQCFALRQERKASGGWARKSFAGKDLGSKYAPDPPCRGLRCSAYPAIHSRTRRVRTRASRRRRDRGRSFSRWLWRAAALPMPDCGSGRRAGWVCLLLLQLLDLAGAAGD